EQHDQPDRRRDGGVQGGQEHDEDAVHDASSLRRARGSVGRGARHDRFSAEVPMTTAPAQPDTDTQPEPRNSVDRFFEITKRGSSFAAEIRGGVVTFVTMAYI